MAWTGKTAKENSNSVNYPPKQGKRFDNKSVSFYFGVISEIM